MSGFRHQILLSCNRTKLGSKKSSNRYERLGADNRYDLKTASRLYVLEPHHKPVSSVTFSPDGRRLITVSLEEGCVTVWKVGSSLSGFFNVGGLPRQGGLGLAGGSPFKRIEFARSDDGEQSSCFPLPSFCSLDQFDLPIVSPGFRRRGEAWSQGTD